MVSSFLFIPLEIRLGIYELYLSSHIWQAHAVQPSNAHLTGLPSVCKQIASETNHLLSEYISLPNESVIASFVAHATDRRASRIRFADVANDDRMVSGLSDSMQIPVSQLHAALRKMGSLQWLRVWDPTAKHRSYRDFPGARFFLQFEAAMYPLSLPPALHCYELWLNPTHRAEVFEILPSPSVKRLRLSGNCRIRHGVRLPFLRHLAICGATGPYLDQHLQEHFHDSVLQTFQWKQGDRLGFEISDDHLRFLTAGPGRSLNKLVLLGCRRLSSLCLASCLQDLPSLEYFALSLITTHELNSNFVAGLPLTLTTLKLKLINALHMKPFEQEERDICQTLEEKFMLGALPCSVFFICLRSEVISEGGRDLRWRRIAASGQLTLSFGDWEAEEYI